MPSHVPFPLAKDALAHRGLFSLRVSIALKFLPSSLTFHYTAPWLCSKVTLTIHPTIIVWQYQEGTAQKTLDVRTHGIGLGDGVPVILKRQGLDLAVLIWRHGLSWRA